MGKRTITADSTVYSAAVWWSDNDPFMNVVATTAKKAEVAAMKLMRNEARSAIDNYEMSYKDAMAELRWSGVHAFTLKDLASSRELEEAISELSDSGLFYLSR